MPTGIALVDYLPSCRVVDQMHKDVGVVLVGFFYGPLRRLAGGQEHLNLSFVLLSHLEHTLVELVQVDIVGVKNTVLLIEANTVVLVSGPDLVNVVLACLSKYLPTSYRAAS